MDLQRHEAKPRQFGKALVFLIIFSPLAYGVIHALVHPSFEGHMIMLSLLVMGFVAIYIETSVRPLREQLDRIEDKLDATLHQGRSSEHESQTRL
jgi:hypothetical protein